MAHFPSLGEADCRVANQSHVSLALYHLLRAGFWEMEGSHHGCVDETDDDDDVVVVVEEVVVGYGAFERHPSCSELIVTTQSACFARVKLT